MSQYNRVFIIGHPGAGKALLAKSVAEKLGWEFINADFGLESNIGRNINDILGAEGTKQFHQCQYDLYNSLLNDNHIVVTTDASIVGDDKLRQLLSSEYIVYLEVDINTQLARCAIRDQRPLLLKNDITSFFDELHQERDNLYSKMSTITINSNDNNLEQHISSVIKLISDNKSDQSALNKADVVMLHKTLHTPIYLTEQQARCLKLLAQGKTSKEIAREMDISFRTVENYILKITELLGCTSSKELIVLYHNRP